VRFEEEMFKSDADREQAEQSHRGALETIATMTAQVITLHVCVCMCAI
jgi:hypothetical protein